MVKIDLINVSEKFNLDKNVLFIVFQPRKSEWYTTFSSIKCRQCVRCGESKLQTVFVIPLNTRDVFQNISIDTSENVDEQTAQNGYIEPASSQNAKMPA
jgi:hypothetical protein